MLEKVFDELEVRSTNRSGLVNHENNVKCFRRAVILRDLIKLVNSVFEPIDSVVGDAFVDCSLSINRVWNGELIEMLEVQKESERRVGWNSQFVILKVVPVDIEFARDLAF